MELGGETREGCNSQVRVHQVFYILLHRVEVCAKTNLSFECCVTVGNELWLPHPPLDAWASSAEKRRDNLGGGGGGGGV